MLRSTKEFEQYAIAASDGVCGHVRDFYFDDHSWVIRYLVVGLGSEVGGHRILMSPHAILSADWPEKTFRVGLTQSEVRHSADALTVKPVSRQHAMGYYGYDGYGKNWGGGGLWGAGFYPDILQAGMEALEREQTSDDPRLRSANAVARYYVHASDGDIGHVSGFLVDDHSWAIRYVLVDTSNWWLGHQVIIAPEWIEDVDWAECIVSVDLSRQAVKDSPLYEPERTLEREQELCTHRHYGRDGYWPRASAPGSSPPSP
jgi:hypothetical protein